MAKYRMVYHDGSNGFRLGEVYDLEPNEDGELVTPDEDEEGAEGQVFTSRNGDGLYESEEGDTLLVPLGGG